MLSEIAHSEARTLRELLQKLRTGGEDSGLAKRVVARISERLGLEAGEGGENPFPDGDRSWPDAIRPQDIADCLEEFVERGDMEILEGRIQITLQGSRKLASMVRRQWQAAVREDVGPHPMNDSGYGVDLTSSSRRYRLGDDYRRIDVARTCLNSIERSGVSASGRLALAEEDFAIHESTDETQISMVLLVDESASMGQEKRRAAVETCLSLSEVREPRDLLKVFIFSSQAKEIPYWELVNIHAPAELTDMRLALQTARRALRHRKGDRRVYLLTDAEPNAENGKYVGFDQAMPGMLREALHYRQNGITLHLAMLDDNPVLRQFASRMAQLNGGQVYFTSPADLQKVVLESYLAAKRRAG